MYSGQLMVMIMVNCLVAGYYYIYIYILKFLGNVCNFLQMLFILKQLLTLLHFVRFQYSGVGWNACCKFGEFRYKKVHPLIGRFILFMKLGIRWEMKRLGVFWCWINLIYLLLFGSSKPIWVIYICSNEKDECFC